MAHVKQRRPVIKRAQISFTPQLCNMTLTAEQLSNFTDNASLCSRQRFIQFSQVKNLHDVKRNLENKSEEKAFLARATRKLKLKSGSEETPR